MWLLNNSGRILRRNLCNLNIELAMNGRYKESLFMFNKQRCPFFLEKHANENLNKKIFRLLIKVTEKTR